MFFTKKTNSSFTRNVKTFIPKEKRTENPVEYLPSTVPIVVTPTFSNPSPREEEFVFEIPHLNTIVMPIVYDHLEYEKNENTDDDLNIFLVPTHLIEPFFTLRPKKMEEEVFQIQYNLSTNIPIQISSPPVLSNIGENPLDNLLNLSYRISPFMENVPVSIVQSTYNTLTSRSVSKTELPLSFPFSERPYSKIKDNPEIFPSINISYRISPFMDSLTLHEKSKNTLVENPISNAAMPHFINTYKIAPFIDNVLMKEPISSKIDVLGFSSLPKREMPLSFPVQNTFIPETIKDPLLFNELTKNISTPFLAMKDIPFVSPPTNNKKTNITNMDVFVKKTNHKMSFLQEPMSVQEIPVLENKHQIPLLLFQTWFTKDLPVEMKKNMETLISKNPEFTHFLFDDNDCREFIRTTYDPSVLHAYDSLIPGAYKADLWRYCILYAYGGVYLDIKFTGYSLVSLTDKEYFVRDLPSSGGGIYNGFMVCFPQNPILKKCILAIVRNVKINFYGSNALCPTGPLLLSKFFSRNDKRKVELDLRVKDGIHYLFFRNNIVLYNYQNYRTEQKNTSKIPSYGVLWEKRQIYQNHTISLEKLKIRNLN